MKKRLLIIYGAISLIICIAASARADDGTILGTGIGAAVGGLLGSQIGHGSGQIAAATAGVLLGGVIGNNIGHSIDSETSSAGQNYSSYNNSPAAPMAYNSYRPNYVAPPAPPPPTYVDADEGTYCREYSQEIRIAGRIQESYGTACLQPDGTWRVVQ